MRSGTKLAALGAALVAVVLIVTAAYLRRGHVGPQPRPARNEQAYADPAACALCHAQIAGTYRLTGMARSFSRLRPENPLGDFKAHNRLYHQTSDRYYTMLERGGQFYERRHQLGIDRKETNVVEMQADYEIGSGNHARTFLHRNPDGTLLEMPVSWYSERGGYWAMSPGYDRWAHQDFRRLIAEGCMSCHNGYPRGAVKDEGNGPIFASTSGDGLPEGVDCQRCHGPGQAHVDAMTAGNVDAGRRAIVNPAKLDRDRQLETCMQCHLETTSSPLPFQVRRYEHASFSFTPGKELGGYFIYFDHAPGSSRDNKFEIAGGAYRLRKSACFQRSAMTCLTCHDPHDIPRGAAAVQHYVSVCQSCHQAVHKNGVPQLPGVARNATCLDCHMPERRTEDAVHVIMTDHYIQRRRPPEELLAPRQEAENFDHGDYRGEVALYYPPTLPQSPENALYLALAQVQQGSNLERGIPRLQAAIEQSQPERPDFYYELARAYAKKSDHESAIRWCKEALRREPDFVPALKELAAAATADGQVAQAHSALEKAVALSPRDASAFADLGNVYLLEDRVEDAQKALARALMLDPDLPQANNTMGLAALKRQQTADAEKYFREAIRMQPDLAEAHNNLGNLLAGRHAYAEAEYHFQRAIRSNPDYVDARQSYGMILALQHSYPKAAEELEAAVRLAPGLAQTHTDLADVLAAMGRVDDAAREYEIAIAANPAEYDAHLALGQIRARQRRSAEARSHLQAAAQSSDPATRDAALQALRSLPQ